MNEIGYIYKFIPNREEIEIISSKFNLNKYISAVLIQYFGFDIDKIHKFLNPNTNYLHDPFLLDGIEKCLDIIYTSIKNHENILIYGDYDVDGITGVSILYRFLQKNFKLGHLLSYKTASRFDSGYGLSIDVVNYAIKNSIKLIITVDCGTKDYEPIDFAINNGLNVVVIDHHEFGDRANIANAILNPKVLNSKYPFRDLSGCGVVFKMLQAFCIRFKINDDVYDYLDLLALSICCDIVPLVDENRILLVKGLEKINNNPQLGLKCLIANLELKNIDTNDISLKIGPRINSPGRIGSPLLCVDLFTNDDINVVNKLIDELNSTFVIRKKLCSDAMIDIEKNIDTEDKTIPTIVYKNDWNLGILGILASKCVEKKYVPSVVMSDKNEDYIVGSVRSIEGIDIVNILSSCKDLLVKFGGHKMAAGFSLKKNNLNEFKKMFSKNVSNLLKNGSFKFNISINLKLPIKYITGAFYKDLSKLSPFGFCNSSPIFESIVLFVDSSFSYNDTICKIKIDNSKDIYGIIRGKNIIVTGFKIIQYSVFFDNVVGLDIFNILDVSK